MVIIPAIDLMQGKCVRLIQGEYHHQITYETDPVTQANQFAAEGAEWLHIVDLEGAKVGKPVNTDVIAQIASLGKFKIEVGGGIRDEDAVNDLLNLGLERVIIGTRAISNFHWFSQITEKFENKIALALDAKGSKVATHAWTQKTGQDFFEFAAKADELPLAAIIYTDITKDGMMDGPNFERTKELTEQIKTPIVASGGVDSIENIKKLKELNLQGIIIGRALYEKTLSLPDAINALK
ncbi:MAG: 1-(5-phosphoribosyl)-5-[(5-phosphoribosylamino)methylideneamino]imidazole-4-carboxamide isomerase [Planctomycetota bacterium]|jgi:phosphoribosylformimino-5-aminoimidazole carboxamide ribotide isomerase